MTKTIEEQIKKLIEIAVTGKQHGESLNVYNYRALIIGLLEVITKQVSLCSDEMDSDNFYEFLSESSSMLSKILDEK